MVFSSILFLFYFLPLVLAFYHIVPARYRNPTLLAASLIFYIWGEPVFVWVLFLSIIVNYGLGLIVDRVREQPTRARPVLAAAVIVNVGLLGFFKYANFFVDNFNNAVSGRIEPIVIPAIALPVGISFFTFHALSYVFDIYRGKARVQKNPFELALYIVLFPQLIAGPIVRYHDISDQLSRRRITAEMFANGIYRFVIGLAKKVLIANTVAQVADQIFALDTGNVGTALAWLGIVCYTLQIYFDFSGYSDMAIGLALMFGFRFPENFNYPYAARSIQDFWRRWHITLSNWFRDYVYIPLGGNRKGVGRTYLNLYIVFFLTGLWHGASWNFVLWGLLHGTFMVIERVGLGRVLETLWRPFQHLYTLMVVMIAWVFFRIETLPNALSYLGRMFSLTSENAANPIALYLDTQILLVLLLGVLFSVPIHLRLNIPQEQAAVLRMAAFTGLFVLSAMSLAVNTYNPFIYFRF